MSVIADEVMVMVRAWIVGDWSEFHWFGNQVTPAVGRGFGALVVAGFGLALHRRFVHETGCDWDAVFEFAAARSRGCRCRQNPCLVTTLILHGLEGRPESDLAHMAPKDRTGTRAVLFAALIEDELELLDTPEARDAALDQRLAEAREHGQKLLCDLDGS